MSYLGAGVKQKAQWGEFTNLGILIQNSGFNIFSQELGAWSLELVLMVC